MSTKCRIDGSTAQPDDALGSVELAREERVKPKLPKRYAVLMMNDDYTPMEFVVSVLQDIFGMDEEKAVSKMLEVHTRGSAVCGVYTREIAETKCDQAVALARGLEHPLLCRVEPLENKGQDDD
ncbi:MAG: ATP-dependent Clp protease adapter ClpS [Gammaproteobacteria bacterium]